MLPFVIEVVRAVGCRPGVLVFPVILGECPAFVYVTWNVPKGSRPAVSSWAHPHSAQLDNDVTRPLLCSRALFTISNVPYAGLTQFQIQYFGTTCRLRINQFPRCRTPFIVGWASKASVRTISSHQGITKTTFVFFMYTCDRDSD